MKKVRVRIAPSPTGIPHIGNTRTALFNYLFAKHNNGEFILRIEDTDQARIVKGAKEAISEILKWLGLLPDETYIQSERLSLYQEKVQFLLKSGLARKDDKAVRFIVPKGKNIEWQDAIGSKNISFKTETIEDFVILKSDGFPTYHLANVVDDCEMKITHVIRGDEWISSTPKHILLYEAFGWELPLFAHLPLILGPDKTKLSKRHGAESVLEYREKGYLKEAIINFLMLLGWTHPEQKDIFSLEEAIKFFDLSDVNTASPIFDVKKLDWMNGVYIRQLSVNELKLKVKNQKSKLQLKIQKLDVKTFDKLIVLAQTRMKTLNDFAELVNPWFETNQPNLTNQEKVIAKKLLEVLLGIKEWNSKPILEALQGVLKSEEIKMKVIYKILTGQETGLPLGETLEILGKENAVNKLEGL